jgi:hypothetical protein
MHAKTRRQKLRDGPVLDKFKKSMAGKWVAIVVIGWGGKPEGESTGG